MTVNRVEFHLMDGDTVLATGDDAVDFSEDLRTGKITGDWLIFPISEDGYQQILHLSLVTRIAQWHEPDETEGEANGLS